MKSLILCALLLNTTACGRDGKKETHHGPITIVKHEKPNPGLQQQIDGLQQQVADLQASLEESQILINTQQETINDLLASNPEDEAVVVPSTCSVTATSVSCVWTLP